MKIIWALVVSISFKVSANEIEQYYQDDLGVSISTELWSAEVASVTTKDGNRVELFLTPDELVETTEAGASIHIKLEKKDWVVDINTLYSSSKGQNAIVVTPYGDIPIEIDNDATIVELMVGKRFGEDKAYVEILAGARYFESKADNHTPIGSITDELTYAQPIVGFEIRKQLMNRVSLTSRVNVGNFQGKSLSYDAVAAINFQINKYFHVSGGYRYQELTFDDNKESINMNNITKGPFVTIAVKL